jgi:putative transcriptional regulator
MELHNRLKEIRTQRSMTQEALGQVVGVTRQTIIAIEKEHFVPSVKLSLELSHALGARLDELFWLVEEEGA